MTSEDIYRARVALGMSQAAFAVAVGTAREVVNRWERGKQKPSNMAATNIKRVMEIGRLLA